MPLNISRAMIDALWPKGAIWTPAPDGGLDLFLDGNAENKEIVRIALEALATIQIADLTQYLDDMEREYGLIFDDSLSEPERRARLKNAITANQGYGTPWDMQTKLRAAGFTDIYVYQNDPPVDINLFLGNTPNVTFGDPQMSFGNPAFTFANSGGELVVNGAIFYAGASFQYPIPGAEYWPSVFFVGGQATFSDVTKPNPTFGSPQMTFGNPVFSFGGEAVVNEITAIDQIEIPIERREELRRLIVKYKPIHAWCALRIIYI